MVADNIFRMLEHFFVNIMFKPFDALRAMALEEGGWWTSNSVNIIFILINFFLLGYWIRRSIKYRKTNTEDFSEE